MARPVAYTPEGIPISDASLHDAIASGAARFKTGDTVHFVSQTGDHYSVPGEQAWKEIKQGAKPITNTEYEHYEAVKTSSESPLETAKTAGAGLARTLTMGASDPLLESLSPGYAKNEAIRQEANPAAKEASEILGYALPIAGEVGLGGRILKGATAIPRAVSQVGRTAGKGATSALGEGITKRVVGGVATGAVEGTGFGIQQGISNQTVHDEPLTAQNILLNTGIGAGLGGLLGGIEHVVKSKASVKLSEKVDNIQAEKPSLLEPRAPVEPIQSGKPSLIDRAKQTVADASVGMELRGSGLIGSDVKRIVQQGGPESAERIAQRLRNEAGVEIGDNANAIYGKYKAVKAEAGQTFETMQNTLEERRFRVDANQVLDDIDQNVLKPLRESGLKDNRRLANRIDDGILSDFRKQTSGETDEFLAALKAEKKDVAKSYADHMYEEFTSFDQPTRTVRELDRLVRRAVAAKAGDIEALARTHVTERGLGGIPKPELTFAELRELRKQIDKKLDLDKAAGDLTEKGKIIRGIRDEMEQSLNRQIAAKVDPELAKAYTSAKLRYKDWAQVTELLRKRMGVNVGNRFVSLTDTVAAGEGAAHAGALGALTGLIANKTIRSPAASRIGAEIANKLAGDRAVLSAGGINREASNAVGKTAQAINETVQKSGTPIVQWNKAAAYQVPVAIGKSAVSLYEFNKRINSFGNSIDPEHEQKLALLDGQPGLQAQVALAQTSAQKVATDLLPSADQPVNPVLGEHQPPPPESRAQEYADVVKLLNEPKTVLDKFADGTLTRAQVAALNQALPLAMQQLQMHALEGISKLVEKGKTPDYQTRLKLGLLTGKPVDPSDTLQFTSTIQGMYAQNPKMEAPPKVTGSRRASRQAKMADRRESSTDRFNH
jgi:hypothetical protein